MEYFTFPVGNFKILRDEERATNITLHLLCPISTNKIIPEKTILTFLFNVYFATTHHLS